MVAASREPRWPGQIDWSTYSVRRNKARWARAILPCSPRVRLPPQHLNGIERAGAFHQGIGGQAVVENFAGRFDAGYWQVIRVDQAELDQD